MMEPHEIIASLLDQAQDRDSFIDQADPECIFRHDAAALEAAVELLQKAYTANEPLTLDELRQMDGEPVWFVNIKSSTQVGYGGWRIVRICDPEGTVFDFYGSVVLKPPRRCKCDYGKTWLAYRHRPKEVQP